MPNYEAAAAVLDSMFSPGDSGEGAGDVTGSTESDSNPVSDESTPVAETTEEPVDAAPAQQEEKPAEPDIKALRHAELQARIQRLQEQNRERAESKRLSSLKAELEAAKSRAQREAEEIEKTKSIWKSALRNPVKAFQELGIDPVEAYTHITKSAQDQDTPEGREARFREAIRQELMKELEPKLSKAEQLEKKLSEIEQREQLRAQREMMSMRQAAEAEFLKVVKSGHDVLADYYDDEELIPLGDQIAEEFASEGKRFTIPDVVKEIERRLTMQLKRAEERSAKRKATLQSASGQTVQETTKVSDAKDKKVANPNTVTNSMASATAGTSKQTLSREERLRLAAAELEAAERKQKK